MLDCRIFDWLSARALSFSIQHNAHRDAETTVARHLLHLERIGDGIVFAGDDGRAACIEADCVWELAIRDRTGAHHHIVAPSLQACLLTAQHRLAASMLRAVAA